MGDPGPRQRSTNIQDGFLRAGGASKCPVEGCQRRVATRTAMMIHLLHLHFRDTVIILEEGNLPHPGCPRCYMLVPWRYLNGRHIITNQCSKGSERKIWRLVEEEMQEIVERAFQAYGRLLVTVTSFKCLGWVLTEAY